MTKLHDVAKQQRSQEKETPRTKIVALRKENNAELDEDLIDLGALHDSRLYSNSGKFNAHSDSVPGAATEKSSSTIPTLG